MRVLKGFLVVLFAVAVVSCLPEQEVKIYSVSYFFKDSLSGWQGDFSDYPVDTAGYRLRAELDTLPYNLNADSTKKAIQLSGIDSAGDLFMFIKRKVSGLRKNTTYEILFNVRLASNAPTGEVDGGGVPGENVYLKVGASTIEPEKEIVEDSYQLNIDKGNQSEDGENMIFIGNIAVAVTTPQKYALIVKNNNSLNGIYATTNDAGELWLIVGTDSDFEGQTTLYYTQIDVLFNQVD
jgi:hypothetical protein